MLYISQAWAIVAGTVAALTEALGAVAVEIVAVVTVAEAGGGPAATGRTRRRSGCPAPS